MTVVPASEPKITRFWGFTACGMPLCTKGNNFILPLFLAIMDFSSGACSKLVFLTVDTKIIKNSENTL